MICIPYEEDITAIVTWLREALQGKHEGEFIRRDYTFEVTHYGWDREKLGGKGQALFIY